MSLSKLGRWWRTWKPGVPQSTGSQRVRYYWATEQQQQRFVIAFLPRSKHLLISWLLSPSTEIWEPKNIKSLTASTFPPSICREVMGPDAMSSFWMFKASSFTVFFTLVKRLFSSSSLSASKVVLSAYLRLLIFLPAILISLCDSSYLAFHIMYSVYQINTQGDNTQP